MGDKVKCDKCGKKFNIELKTRKLPLGVVEVYFICPHCKHKYISFYTDEAIREKQKKITKMRDEYRQAKSQEEAIKVMDKIAVLKAEIKDDMEELKKKMQGTQ